MKKIFGNEIIDRTHEVWGLDEEGELRGCYRPSGQPGVSFSPSNILNMCLFIYHSRSFGTQPGTSSIHVSCRNS